MSDAPADRQFLEELLRKTLVAPNPSEVVDAADLRALRDVYERHRGQPCGLEPVSIELVEAMLRSYFDTWSEAGELVKAMSVPIARTLFDDPVSRERLERLWAHLGEVSR